MAGGPRRVAPPSEPGWYRPVAFAATAIMLVLLMVVIRGIEPPGQQHSGAGTTMALGFLLLAATLMGVVAEAARLPRITGFLVAGLLLGPEVMGLVTSRNLLDFSALSRFAIGIIAFVAGGELKPNLLRGRVRGLLTLLLSEMGAVLILVGALLLALRHHIPFLAGREWLEVIALTLVFASIATVHSPAVTIALLNETGARGPVATTSLAVVVLADVIVVLLVSLALSFANTVVGGGGFSATQLAIVAWELIGAAVVGALLGFVVALYLRHVGRQLVFFVIFLVFFGYEIAQALHVEFMLFMLAAGFFVENISPVEGEPLIRAVDAISVPAYALFFAIAGASIHLTELAELWPLALAIVATRALALRFGSRWGARAAGMEPAVQRLLWRGLVSQAGVALGLATVAARVLGESGSAMLTMFLAMIAIHELIGPLLFRSALAAAGELKPRHEETDTRTPVPAG